MVTVDLRVYDHLSGENVPAMWRCVETPVSVPFCAVYGDGNRRYFPRINGAFEQATAPDAFIRMLLHFSLVSPYPSPNVFPQALFPQALPTAALPVPDVIQIPQWQFDAPLPPIPPGTVHTTNYWTDPVDAIGGPGVMSFDLKREFPVVPLVPDAIGLKDYVWNNVLPGDFGPPGTPMNPATTRKMYIDLLQPPWNNDPVVKLWGTFPDVKPPLFLYMKAQVMLTPGYSEPSEVSCGLWLVVPTLIGGLYPVPRCYGRLPSLPSLG